jgi:3-phosphoshikimate 1-carboxyvinyltransferase
MTDLVVHPATRPLRGSVPVPADKSIVHRALLLSALCNGKSRLKTSHAIGEDNASTRAALAAMGVGFGEDQGSIVVHGVGLFGLRAPEHDLDCGNSGTTMRLLCGILAAQPFASVLVGDASLTKRPMLRIVEPLRKRGAHISGTPTATNLTAPLQITGLAEGEYLGPLEHDSAVASAQVKSAILLSGLYAHGTTTLREPTLSRDHTERMLHALGAPLKTAGTVVELDPAGWGGVMPPMDVTIPGDISAAAFILGAALLVPGSTVTCRGVGVNKTRTGALDVLAAMNASITTEPLGDEGGEPVSNLHVANTREAPGLAPTMIASELVPRAIDEIPLLCAVAARANGTTVVHDAAELRVKESDRIEATVAMLRAFGVECEALPDGMRIEGKRGARGAAPKTPIMTHGDHRIAMTAAILALGVGAEGGPTRIRDCACIATSFPKFVATLRALGASVDVE